MASCNGSSYYWLVTKSLQARHMLCTATSQEHSVRRLFSWPLRPVYIATLEVVGTKPRGFCHLVLILLHVCVCVHICIYNISL